VIAETAYPIRRQLGAAAEAAFFRAAASGELQLEPLTPADGRRIERRHFGTVRPRHAAAFVLVP
jgi:hypothetical protein